VEGDRGLLAIGLNNRGSAYGFLGDYASAWPYYREALEVREGLHGPSDPRLSVPLANLACAYRRLGAFDLASECAGRALALDLSGRRLLGVLLAAIPLEYQLGRGGESLIGRAISTASAIPDEIETAEDIEDNLSAFEELGRIEEARQLREIATGIRNRLAAE